MEGLERKLLEVIATKVIQGDDLIHMALPEPFGIVRWTGWLSSPVSIEKHGHIIWVVPQKTEHVYYYVDLPSMNHGRCPEGNLIKIEMVSGQSKTFGHWEQPTVEQVREMFIQGFELLLRDVIEDNPWIVDVPKGEV